MSDREHVTLVHGIFGDEWQCKAGQTEVPSGCERHPSHFWCSTCDGFYGVPHKSGGVDIHSGIGKHPRGGRDSMQCACRPCKIASGREPARAGRAEDAGEGS